MKKSDIMLMEIPRRWQYDVATGTVVNRWGRTVYGRSDGRGYLQTSFRRDGKWFDVSLHHVVWVLNYGYWPTEIDHINGDGTDNRIENLREVDHWENDQNRLFAWRRRNGRIPGVTASRRGCRFRAGGREYFHKDAYACFHDLSILGRMFRAE